MELIVVYVPWVVCQLVAQFVPRSYAKKMRAFELGSYVTSPSALPVIAIYGAAWFSCLAVGRQVHLSSVVVQLAAAIVSLGFAVASFMGAKMSWGVILGYIFLGSTLAALAVIAALHGFGATDTRLIELLGV